MSFDNEEPFSFTSAAPSLDRKRCEKILRFTLFSLTFYIFYGNKLLSNAEKEY